MLCISCIRRNKRKHVVRSFYFHRARTLMSNHCVEKSKNSCVGMLFRVLYWMVRGKAKTSAPRFELNPRAKLSKSVVHQEVVRKRPKTEMLQRTGIKDIYLY